ncbi:kinase non-catalytic C-lobe domain-containing protein 1 [Syngnathus scovelli]|uniref:kinase non-catalytic C-lobe domain-containing protein 1 n=1 Tax=Syngnathus scovelli TaxID=161590 RepID=UPI002110D947|nr:kinase non-catalytic C-lobe domain-containing protein 1 [Syngnathus scovelli]
METSWRDAYYEIDHLPPLLEDEENVSLADILTLRDSCLCEEDVWAVCAECVVALQSIRPSHLFHTLCITPDTLAFNAHGNVCFMEQLSDDPEGLFVPPEFDNTGSTFEGHVFSLGSTLSAALNFVIEPELEAELGEETQKLLEKMQEKKPEDRPLIQDILFQAQARLRKTSSAAVCRKLSSVGRRVLSIESISNFQDGQENSEAMWQRAKSPKKTSFDIRKDIYLNSAKKTNGLSRQQVCLGWDSSLWAEDADNADRWRKGLADELDCSTATVRAQQRFNRMKGALNRSCSVPDSNNPPFPTPPHGNISVPVSDLTEIGANEHLSSKSVCDKRSKRLARGRSCESYTRSSAEDCLSSLVDGPTSRRKNEDAVKSSCHLKDCHEEGSPNLASSGTSAFLEYDNFGAQISKKHKCYVSKSKSQDEWSPLRELLAHCGLGLTVNELWALCYTCLSSLQTYTDFPAFLSLDTVYISHQGELVFSAPKSFGSEDTFYLSPEYQEHGIVTEKACVYGVAAILWTTAKFNLLPSQKLVMPRKLKRLLLEMANNTPVERPSIALAKQSCCDYLSRQGTNAETVWKQLITRVHATVSRSIAGEDLALDDTNQSLSQDTSHMSSATVDSSTRRLSVPQAPPSYYMDAGLSEGDCLAGASHESPSEARYTSDDQMSRDRSEELDDRHSQLSEQLISPGSRADLYFRPAWDLALFEEDCFSSEVIQYALSLGQYRGSSCLDVKTQELQQQLMIETRNLKKMRTFYQKLIQQDRQKGFENKGILSKVKAQLEELRSKVIFLDNVKKYLQTQRVDQRGLDVALLPSLSACGLKSLAAQSPEDTSFLSFATCPGKRNLQAGTPLGLMAYLYARNAASEGFIQQFLYTYRFFCTCEHLLQFIMETFISAVREGPDRSEKDANVFHRSLDLLHVWILDCKMVDFTPKSNIVGVLENFLRTVVIPVDSRGHVLLAALQNPPRKIWSTRRGSQIQCVAEDQWGISRVVESSASIAKEDFSIAAALPVPCYSSLVDEPSSSHEKLTFSQKKCNVQQVAQQLTLLQQDVFQGCHPVHFLNSRIQGIRDKPVRENNSSGTGSQQIPPVESSRLSHASESESRLQQLLAYSDTVMKWVAGEIVICDSIKEQVALLTKYLWIGKHCYESRNFATAMQVLEGLENTIVRQLPAWKHLSSKMLEILEELRAVQVFLKSDNLCLIAEEQKRRPTLPSAHILAMHIQQLEIGAFALTTGAYKWTKLRRIAKVVSQVHAFQELVFTYSPDRDMQAYLCRRITELGNRDIDLRQPAAAADAWRSAERQTRRVQEMLTKVKASLQ